MPTKALIANRATRIRRLGNESVLLQVLYRQADVCRSPELRMKVGNWNQARCVAGQKQNPVLLQSIQQAIDALQKGGLMIVVDDDDRENEGDFIGAAESITPEPVDFMVRIGRGTLCVPVTSEDAARLKLRPVVDESSNNAPNKTAFLRAVDYISAGTGVSALNRSRTIRGLGEEISMTRNQIDHTWGTTC